MIASLPMYDRAETRDAWNRFWTLCVAEARSWTNIVNQPLPDLPDHLTWDAGDAEHWLRPDLALSQTCSLPYRTRLHGHVTLLGAFDFGLPNCPPGYYNSILVMRKDDPRHAPEHWPDLTLAYNAPDSQSGWAAPYFHLHALGLRFPRGVETGAHAASAKAVADGRADIAALDAQSYRLLRRYAPFMEALTEVAQTEATPSLPLITSRGWDAGEFWAAMTSAFDALAPEDQTTLDLRGLVTLHPERYTALPIPPAPGEVFAD